MKFRNALVAATMLALPVAAKAQPITGLYIGGAGGVNIMHDESTQIAGGALQRGGHLETRVGPAVDLDIGYGLGNGLRVELEGSYRYNTIKGLGGGNNSAGGQEQKFGPMVNVIYDVADLIPYVQPYVGVGGGYIFTQDRNLRASGPGFAANSANRTVGSIGYQGILGAALPIETVPGLAVTADYRFLGLVGHRNYPGTVNGVPGKIRLEDDFNHTILIGLRYNFGVAPPPVAAPAAAPVPASPVSRSYLVFFDWDKATLTDRARQIVSEAAANSTKVQYTQLEVNGYTDTSGTARYNQGLSVRRANVVAAELVRDGVPKSAISIQGFGETHLLVPTGQGVREPQNRRVEISIK